MMFKEYLKMGYEIEAIKPNKIKVTQKFADYLDKQCVQWLDKPSELSKGGMEVQFDGIPIEIDDTIDNDYYKFVY